MPIGRSFFGFPTSTTGYGIGQIKNEESVLEIVVHKVRFSNSVELIFLATGADFGLYVFNYSMFSGNEIADYR